MTLTHAERKMIWAIDPFEETLKSRSQLITALRHVSRQQKIEIEPVYVLNLSLEKEDVSTSDRSQVSQYRYAAEKAAREAVKNIEGIELLPPRILTVEESSSVETVKTLVNYAHATHALLIVVGTHAREGLPRLFLGSFAETLLLHSQVPVITIGPECLTGSLQNQILFATDFDECSAQAYQKVVRFAKSMSAEITLFHSIPHRIEPLLQSGAYLLSGGWVSTPDYLSEKEEFRRKRADKWVSEAKELGITVNIHFEFSRGNISDLILKQAKTQNVGWIAMAAESGAVSSALIGSITRQVVRHSPCPVWVFRSYEGENSGKMKDEQPIGFIEMISKKGVVSS